MRSFLRTGLGFSRNPCATQKSLVGLYLDRGAQNPQNIQKRFLNVHEYVSYTFLSEHGISVPNFGLAKTSDEAFDIAKKMNTKDLVIKAQVLTGGRGKGHFTSGLQGGVHLVTTPEEIKTLASKMIGSTLITKQTGAAGKPCNKVLVTEKKTARKEYYFAIMMERAYGGPVVISSSEGGVEIETVAEKNPKAIKYTPIDIVQGLSKEAAEKIASDIGLGQRKGEIAEFLLKFYDLFLKKDATLVEVNPFTEDVTGKFFCLDAKLNFDDNAEFRQKAVFDYRDFTQEDIREVEAHKYGLNYISLDGNIGCMVNGAGLAMATMDIIKISGGFPANFLDVGGGATAKQVTEALKIITTDPKVSAIFVNIFGGIMRCDIIAEGIIAAAKELDLKVPIVCRLQGTNTREAKELIQKSSLRLIPEDDFSRAASTVVKIAKIVELAKEANVAVSISPIK
uniref:Succinate--CoA ligase [ADP-forming] subunit beta, mitochondrial n=2 Tax=Lygus hesperus TaxID=30085 RepID=A0A146LKW6_LYGHE